MINEDIRFYRPSDPYYYEVDNLPLGDLLGNDKDLQAQIDALSNPEEEGGETFSRDRFDELRPYSKQVDPGKIFVKPGSFVGRNNRSTNATWPAPGNTEPQKFNGVSEADRPFENRGDDVQDYDLRMNNQVGAPPVGSRTVARTSVFRYNGLDSMEIPVFDPMEFDTPGGTTPPLGRLDLVVLTTNNGGAMDENVDFENMGDVKLALVKGAGIMFSDSDSWERKESDVVFKTLGTAQEDIPLKGHGLSINVQDNPEFGTVPSPDDVVNSFWVRNSITMHAWEVAHHQFETNDLGQFGLPVAYVFVPAGYQPGQHIPAEHIIDIRPFFRTAELTLRERQACAMGIAPGRQNPFVTAEHLRQELERETNKTSNKPPLQDQIDSLSEEIGDISHDESWFWMNGDESGEGWALSIRDKFYETIFLKPGRYMAHCQYFCSFDGVQGAGFKGTAVAYRHNTINPPLTGFNSNLHTLSRGFPPYSRKYGAGNTITSNAKIQFMRSRNNDDDMGGSTIMLDFQVEDEAASIGGVAGAAVPVTLRMTMLGTGGECHINLVGCYIQKIGEL